MNPPKSVVFRANAQRYLVQDLYLEATDVCSYQRGDLAVECARNIRDCTNHETRVLDQETCQLVAKFGGKTLEVD